MNIHWLRTISCALLAALAIGVSFAPALAADDTAAPATAPEAVADKGWPRQFKSDDYEVIVHQPQVEDWSDYQTIHFSCAIVVGKEGKPDTREYGILRLTASTTVDFVTRTVLLDDRKVVELKFPGVDHQTETKLTAVVLDAAPPKKPMTISLDRLMAAVEIGKVQAREVKVNLDPPPIFASEKPAVLVIFAGTPRFKKVDGTNLMFASNTNWDVFLDMNTQSYFLLNGDSWLTAKDAVKGPWTPAGALPADLSKLPAEENWADVRASLPAKPAKTPTAVYVSTEPAELIVTEGEPQFAPIPGTRLMNVSNTDADLFFHTADKNYYFLTAGRWFKSAELSGPWTAATNDLPPDFKAIPRDNEAADVLPSVPGTPEAQEAVIQASIPQKATVQRDLTVTVAYQGEPKFVAIPTTTVQYAPNTPSSVFLVDGKYYCCSEGVWFIASSAMGPWKVCDKVPAAIYTIPASHPMYNVTYVYVYSSTPQVVVVGSTSGYSGQYVSNGVLLFGAGVIVGAIIANNNDDWCYHYHSCYFSYGCGAHYHYGHGYYAGRYRYYGPYGGAGSWAAYNPSTGIYSRGAYRYGPAGSASVRSAYNPWTGNYAARANVNTPYGSWGRSVVTNGDEWVRAGHRSGPGGTVAGIQGSEGGAAIRVDQERFGNGTTIVKDRDGDIYVGKDGNIYKRDENGQWQSRDHGQWTKPEGVAPTPRTQPVASNVDRATNIDRTAVTERPQVERPVPTTPRANPTYNDLNREAISRDRGNYSAQRANVQRSAPQIQRSRPSGGVRRR